MLSSVSPAPPSLRNERNKLECAQRSVAANVLSALFDERLLSPTVTLPQPRLPSAVFWVAPLRRRLRPKYSLKPRPGELHAHEVLAFRAAAHVYHAPLRREIRFRPPRRVSRERNPYLQVRADRQIKPRQKRRSVPTQIFARSFFLESESARILPAHLEREPHRNPSLGSLLAFRKARVRCCRRAQRDHGPGPLFLAALDGAEKSVAQASAHAPDPKLMLASGPGRIENFRHQDRSPQAGPALFSSPKRPRV